MNRSKSLLSSLRLSRSILSATTTHSRSQFNQVNNFHHLSSPSHIVPSIPISITKTQFINNHKKAYFSTTPKSLVSLIAENEWSDELESELESYKPALCHETVVYVLRKLDKEYEKALAFYNWVFEKNGFKPSSIVGSLMLRILVVKDMKMFWVTLRKLKERGFCFDEESYNTILGIFKTEKMLSDASALTQFYLKMKDENALDGVIKKVVKVVLDSEWSDGVEKKLAGLVGNSVSDNFVLGTLRELKKSPTKVYKFFRWVTGILGYEHSTVTYNALARVMGHGDTINEFWGVLDEMKNEGYLLDIDTYIKISRLFQKFTRFEDVVKLYEVMMDGPYKPSVQECYMILRSLSTATDPSMDLMWRVVRKFDSSGHNRSKAVYDGLHRAMTSLGNFDEAEKVVDTMKNAGYEPDNITYSQVVFGLCKFQRFEEAYNVLEKMRAEGCVPDIKTWTILLNGYCRAGEVDRALHTFAKMLEKGVDPDADVLDVLIKGMVDHKKVDRANQFIKEMVGTLRLRPWQQTYKYMIHALLQCRKIEEALNLLLLMKTQNYPPCPELFIDYISKHGTVVDAVEFLKALSSRMYPSISAYVHILRSFLDQGRDAEATDLLYKCPHHIRNHQEISKLFGVSSNMKNPTREGQTSQPEDVPLVVAAGETMELHS